MREKKGEKCYKKMFQWGCYTFGKKSAEIDAPRERAFELIPTGMSGGKCDCSRLVMCSFCTGFVQVLGIVQILAGKERLKPGCCRRYIKVRLNNGMHATGVDAGIARRRVWGDDSRRTGQGRVSYSVGKNWHISSISSTIPCTALDDIVSSKTLLAR
ncbi:MAG: hypothetical protein F4047_06700 [Caldilineaceae bacterium SB0670_bin_27]|nr:hypothetical protein [Caldilineaceae bacterium SB0670_bin_27]